MKNQKKIKSLLVKMLLLGIISFSVMSMLRTNVYDLLHHLSHHFEESDHHSTNHKDSSNHKFLVARTLKEDSIHKNREHDSNHSHKVLYIVYSVLKKNDSQDNNGKQFFEFALDKLIIAKNYNCCWQLTTLQHKNTWFYDENMVSLVLENSYPPPQTES